ncbi:MULTISPECIES: CoA pyrophosphatase [Gammaproteobacteria]|uniref:CoA pyrophosphatase n=1 Tax=Gammaproteobacteria TaxID=1236 RepID=UPI000DCFB943|nr:MULTISPECIES: CoA pyrophosphatase [Gammaproteobacteria]RTE87532.1 CoA pyrophosphatase [Aliidiomarina sp. B3213]TCZ92683.1 CoA pyrophosphatase [Lysobacter sp. N42]
MANYTLEELHARFSLHQPSYPTWPQLDWQPSGVLVPIRDNNGELEVILTRRPAFMRHHANQICFPGGRREPSDIDLRATALRETHEELGIAPEAVNVIGTLPPQPVLTRFVIQPFIGIVETHVEIVPDANEVSEVLVVPLAELVEQANHLQISRNNSMYPMVHFIPWQNSLIWGATAAIIRRLADQLNPSGQEVYRPVF